ncbi:putative mitochondrial protein, partial [Mucuna pruriens]
MFTLGIKTNELKWLKARIKDEAWSCRMRFGQLNFGALKTLEDEKMVKGMPHINHPNQLCEACLLGSMQEEVLLKKLNQEQMSLSNLYTLIRKTWVYFLKNKFEAFVIYKNFKVVLENKSGYNGIHHPLTVPRTPQQNGPNLCLKNFGPKLFNVQLICLITLLQGMSKVKHLKKHEVERIAYAHVPNQRRSKLGERRVKHEKEEDTYDFLPYFEEDDQEVVAPNEFSTPPPLSTPLIHEASSSEGSLKIYDETEITNDLFFLFVDNEPLTFDEAMKDKRWIQAMEEEIIAIKKNGTWELSNLPKGHKAIGVKWVFKIKKNVKREVERYKARLGAKGYKQ